MSDEARTVREGLGQGFPQVQGICPSCGWHSLFLGAGGYVTCAIRGCNNPAAASELLEAQKSVAH